jgi:two-component system response regulator MtrA
MPLKIDLVKRTTLRNGKNIPLTPLEFDLLVALAKEPDQVFTRDQLLQEVWDYEHSSWCAIYPYPPG